MTSSPVTPEIEEAQSAVDAFGEANFSGFHSNTEDYEYSLYVNVSREFDVAELMTGLGVDVDPAYQFRPSPVVAASERFDYELAYAMTSVSQYWDHLHGDTFATTFAELIDENGLASVERAVCILMDSSVMGDLLADYFALEQLEGVDVASARLAEYMRLLDAADNAYRAAGWEL